MMSDDITLFTHFNNTFSNLRECDIHIDFEAFQIPFKWCIVRKLYF